MYSTTEPTDRNIISVPPEGQGSIQAAREGETNAHRSRSESPVNGVHVDSSGEVEPSPVWIALPNGGIFLAESVPKWPHYRDQQGVYHSWNKGKQQVNTNHIQPEHVVHGNTPLDEDEINVPVTAHHESNLDEHHPNLDNIDIISQQSLEYMDDDEYQRLRLDIPPDQPIMSRASSPDVPLAQLKWADPIYSRASSPDIPLAQTRGAPAHMESEDEHEMELVREEGPTFRCISANVQKSRENMNLLLESHRDHDIICIQEPFWGHIKDVPSSKHKDGDAYEQTVTHRLFVAIGASEKSRAMVYVNKRWRSHMPRLRSDLIKHDDINCVELDVGDRTLMILNVYNAQDTHAALDFLEMHAQRLPPITFMCGDFNIRHPHWDSGETRQTIARHARRGDDLIYLAEMELGLMLLNDPHGLKTWLSNNALVRQGVLDLVWIDPAYSRDELRVKQGARNKSDHAVLEWDIYIDADPKVGPTIGKVSEAARVFVREVRKKVEGLPDHPYESKQEVERMAAYVDHVVTSTWDRLAEVPDLNSHSKGWWDAECSQSARETRAARHTLDICNRELRSAVRSQDEFAIMEKEVLKENAQISLRASQAKLRSAARHAKRNFFDNVLMKLHHQKIWDAVKWIKPRPIDATTGIVDANGAPCVTKTQLADAFQEQFCPSVPKPVDLTYTNLIPQAEEREWGDISVKEVLDNLQVTSNMSAPGPNHCSWFWLKRIILQGPYDFGEDDQGTASTASKMSHLFDGCIEFGVFPASFKESRTVIIPKPNKPDYTKTKAYRPIVLLNCIGKLMEKIIAKRMQYEAQKFGILHPCQFGGTMQHSTTDAGIQVVHNVKAGWAKGRVSSALLIDAAQFFPSLNHDLAPAVFRRQGFNSKLCTFFEDYFKGRMTSYCFQGSETDPKECSVGAGQGAVLSPTVTALYLAPALHSVAPTNEILEGDQVLQFFVDDGLIHVFGPKLSKANGGETRQLTINAALLRKIYISLTAAMRKAGLEVEGDKTELMHFWNKRKEWSPAHPLGPDVLLPGPHGSDIIIKPSASLRYLGFYYTPKLSWKEHIRFYANKACSTVNALKLLGNANRGFSPYHKRRLYISNVLPVMLYGAQLWWTPHWKRQKWIASELQQAQSRAARWITGGFKTTPIGALEMMAGLIPIQNNIDKYMSKAALRVRTLHQGHPLRANLPAEWLTNDANCRMPFPLTGEESAKKLETPMSHIHKIGRTSDENFDVLHPECWPGKRVLDTHADRILYFTEAPTKGSNELKDWVKNDLMPRINAVEHEPQIRAVWSDGSLQWNGLTHQRKSGAAWSVRCAGNMLSKRHVALGNASPFDAEMVGLTMGLNDAINDAPEDLLEVHVFADSKLALTSALNPKLGAGQMMRIKSCELVRAFLNANPERRVAFHWVPGHVGIAANEDMDKFAKLATEREQPRFTSWSVARQDADSLALRRWRARMADKKYAGHQNLIKPFEREFINPVAKRHWWLRTMGGASNCGSNGRYARATRLISGHMPIGEFRRRFNLPGRDVCICGKDDTRRHMLTDCCLWYRGWKPPDELTPAQLEAIEALVPGERQNLTQALNRKDLDVFLTMNPMAGTFEWADLCNERDDDLQEGRTDTYAIYRVWVETRLKQLVYAVYNDRATHSNPDSVQHMFMGSAWQSGHEWTLRLLMHKGVITNQQREDPILKARAASDEKAENEGFYSKFIEWFFDHMDEEFRFHAPVHNWWQTPNTRHARHRDRRPDALDWGEDEYKAYNNSSPLDVAGLNAERANSFEADRPRASRSPGLSDTSDWGILPSSQ